MTVLNQTIPLFPVETVGEEMSILGDSCENSRCEHFCDYHNDNVTTCSCKNGFELASDGHSCIGLISFCRFVCYCFFTPLSVLSFAIDLYPYAFADIDECANFGAALCLSPNTQCLNLEGSFSCTCETGFYWSNNGGVCVG